MSNSVSQMKFQCITVWSVHTTWDERARKAGGNLKTKMHFFQRVSSPLTNAFLVSMVDLFSHLGSSSMTHAQSSHCRTNPLSSHLTHWENWQTEKNVFWLFFLCLSCVYMRKLMQVLNKNKINNDYMSTYNTGKNLFFKAVPETKLHVFLSQF